MSAKVSWIFFLVAAALPNSVICYGNNNQNNNHNRRQFLQTSAASILIPPSVALADEAVTDTAAAVSSSSSRSPPLLVENGKIVSMPKIGTGAWAWGDSLFWGYNPKNDADLEEVYRYATEHGGGFFDTAELYGIGRSESLIGQFDADFKEISSQTSIASKFAPFPWRTDRQSVVKAAEASVKRLGGRPIDLYQIHFPNAYSNAAYWDGIGDAYEKGLIRSVGVSNYGKDAIRACHAALAKRGIPLASNQIQMSLLYREPLNNGLKDVCDELDVKVISYSPLGLGLLTGKYDANTLPTGPRKVLAKTLFEQNGNNANELIATMKEIASVHDATCSQVAINWAIAKGTTPIPGARSLKQIKSNLNALDWNLSSAEVTELDKISMKIPSLTPPEKSPFPKVDKDTGLIMFDS